MDNPIGQEDRNRISYLLKKPWNPNVFRHTTATEFAGILSDADAKQWFGWADNSASLPTFLLQRLFDRSLELK